MINPYYSRYPGSGRIPQGNPSDGGSGGFGVDTLGTQFRDWSSPPILARITEHGTDNAYGYEQVIAIDDAAGVAVLEGGIQSDATTTPAYEVNGRTDVAVGTVVVLYPLYGPYVGWSFVTPVSGGNPPTTCITVYAIADLSTSPPTYTVREVYRDPSGVLQDVAGPINYTAYEGGNRQALIDTAGSPTREYPLYQDSAGKYYFEIEQYADGSASPTLPGQVSTTTQVIAGLKKFIDRAEVYNRLTVGNTIASPGDKFTVDVVSATAGTVQWGEFIGPPFNEITGGNMGSGNYTSSFDGFIWCYSGIGFTYYDSGGIYGNVGVGATEYGVYHANTFNGGTGLAGGYGIYNGLWGNAEGYLINPLSADAFAGYPLGGLYFNTSAELNAYSIGTAEHGGTPAGVTGYYGLWAAGTSRGSRIQFLDGLGNTQNVGIAGGIVFNWGTITAFAGGASGGGTPVGGVSAPPFVGGGPKVGGGPSEQFESGTGPEE